MPKVTVPQKNLVLDCKVGENLMDALIAAGLPVASSCLGEGVCSKCAVEMSPVGELSDLEEKTMSRNNLDLSIYRLCCQIFITEDLVVKTKYW
jgi:ferredoxin, 2Fe-2S